MGCVAQVEGEEVLKRNSSVDYVVGPQNIQVIPKLVASADQKTLHTSFLCDEKFDSFPASQDKNISKLLTIQEGM